MPLIIPKDYVPKLNIRDTEAAISIIRETFQDKLSTCLLYTSPSPRDLVHHLVCRLLLEKKKKKI